ncbi:MAG: pyridoxamine 5'-phosphate oxidase family protein [Acidimicrobiales bacterium]|nr:pyridoxamine 5'-phosphate oxidase family protein [Acidimicrobiales bacterium]
MTDLSAVAPQFVAMAHRIVWCVSGTVDTASRPSTRVLHPIWEWDGNQLTGYIATRPDSPKRRHLDRHPQLSCTYWDPTHDTCTAECDASWALDLDERRACWDRILTAPDPVGYDPAIIPGWDGPDSDSFGVLVLRPYRLRVMPGTLMLAGEGELLTWNAG